MASNRQTALSSVRSVVVKLGTQSLTSADGRLDASFLATIAKQIATLRVRGVLMAELKLPKRPTDLAKLQAVAAIGQRRLMDAWADAFEPHAIHVGQVLLTREDIDDRTRSLNVRNTIHAIHEFGSF